MTISAKITSKGQVTLPAKLRRELGLKPGDRIDFRKNEAGHYELVAQTLRFEDLRGILRYDGPPLTSDDIVEIVREAREGRAGHIVSRLKKDGET